MAAEKTNPFEQFGAKVGENNEVKQIEKSEIFNALKEYNHQIEVKKTGKEIKEHVTNVLLPLLEEKKLELKTKISEFLANIAILPTHPVWMKLALDAEEFPYKLYSWEETQYCEKSVGTIFKGFGDCECDGVAEAPEAPKYCISKEEASKREEYNNWVQDLRDIIYDIKTANVLLTNLKDSETYALTLDQLTALQF